MHPMEVESDISWFRPLEKFEVFWLGLPLECDALGASPTPMRALLSG